MFEGIYFANPNYLWLLLLLPAALVWHIFTWRKKQAILKMPSLSGFQGASSVWSKVYPFLFIIRLTVMGLVILDLVKLLPFFQRAYSHVFPELNFLQFLLEQFV